MMFLKLLLEYLKYFNFFNIVQVKVFKCEYEKLGCYKFDEIIVLRLSLRDFDLVDGFFMMQVIIFKILIIIINVFV